jgi:hypothetical protein
MQQHIPAMPDLHGFQSRVPATLLLVHAAEQQIHAAMIGLIGMRRRLAAHRALTSKCFLHDILRATPLTREKSSAIQAKTAELFLAAPLALACSAARSF